MVYKVEMAEAVGEIQNLASEIQINQFKEVIEYKEQKLQKLSFAINNMKEEKKTKQYQYRKRGENIGFLKTYSIERDSTVNWRDTEREGYD